MIVTELMKHGCLSAFLKRHGQAGFAFPPLILVRMLKGVAMGMDYITTLNYVHRCVLIESGTHVLCWYARIACFVMYCKFSVLLF